MISRISSVRGGGRYVLSMDGFVFRMYAPDCGVEQLDGDFGVVR